MLKLDRDKSRSSRPRDDRLFERMGVEIQKQKLIYEACEQSDDFFIIFC